MLAVLPFTVAILALGIDLGSTARLIAASYSLLFWVGAAVAIPSEVVERFLPALLRSARTSDTRLRESAISPTGGLGRGAAGLSPESTVGSQRRDRVDLVPPTACGQQ